VAGPSIAGGIIAVAGYEWVVGAGIVFAFNAVGNGIFAIALFSIRVVQEGITSSKAPPPSSASLQKSGQGSATHFLIPDLGR
jgi:hypothetical protein